MQSKSRLGGNKTSFIFSSETKTKSLGNFHKMWKWKGTFHVDLLKQVHGKRYVTHKSIIVVN